MAENCALPGGILCHEMTGGSQQGWSSPLKGEAAPQKLQGGGLWLLSTNEDSCMKKVSPPLFFKGGPDQLVRGSPEAGLVSQFHKREKHESI